MTFGIGSLHFTMDNPWLFAPCAALLVSLLFSSRAIYLRLFHRSAPRALAVLGLNALAYLVVLLWLLSPVTSGRGSQAVVLLTEGANIDKPSLPVTGKIYIAPGFTASPEARRRLSSAAWLLNTGQLNYRETAIDKLEVRGYGLEREQWENLGNRPEIAFAAPAVDGFHAMHWQRFLTEGETLRVGGRYGQTGNGGVIELRLLDPAGNIAASGRFKYGQDFGLETRVKTRGNLEYQLQAWDAGELRSGQTVAFEAGAGDLLDIMIVQSAPSFETRQLKDFAAATGHRVRVISAISRGKTIWQSANLPEDADTTLSPALLAAQDILIMDGRAFTGLPKVHRQWLSDAVNGGLGLLLLADNSLLEANGTSETALLGGFELAPVNEPEASSDATMHLGATDVDVLVTGDDGGNLAARRSTGLGSVGVSLVTNSHAWMTAGERSRWSDYWSLMLSALARQRGDSFLLQAADADFHRVNRRTALCALTRDDGMDIVVTSLAGNGQRIPLELVPAADTLQSSRRCAFFWPRAAGWHNVLLENGDGTVLDRKSVYVYGPGQWPDQQRAQRAGDTSAWARGAGVTPPAAGGNTVTEPLNGFWMWLTLVLSASLLWLERKLDFT